MEESDDKTERKHTRPEEGPMRVLSKDFKEIRVDGGYWGGDEGMDRGEVGGRDADCDHVLTKPR